MISSSYPIKRYTFFQIHEFIRSRSTLVRSILVSYLSGQTLFYSIFFVLSANLQSCSCVVPRIIIRFIYKMDYYKLRIFKCQVKLNCLYCIECQSVSNYKNNQILRLKRQNTIMQVDITIPFGKYDIYITGFQPDFNIIYSKPKQSLQQSQELNCFLKDIKKLFDVFIENVLKLNQNHQKIESVICHEVQQKLKQHASQKTQLEEFSSGQFDSHKLSMKSEQQNQQWRDQYDLSEALNQANSILNKRISNIVNYESEILTLKRKIKENPINSQTIKSEIVKKQSKIQQIRTSLSKQMKNFTSKISEVIRKKQDQNIKVKRSNIKKQYLEQNIVEVYLVHELSLPKSEIDQLKQFNCTILKQLYLCGNEIGNIGLENLAQIKLTSLKILDLQFNKLTNIQPISNFNYLQQLYLADCQCVGRIKSMNLIVFDKACKVFAKSQWNNLKCLSINFAKSQDQNESTQINKLRKCWQPQLINKFVQKIIQNRNNFGRIQKLQHWCCKCIKSQQILRNFVQAGRLCQQNEIQLKQID